MSLVEPVPDEPAAIAAIDDDRALVIADYHAGVEAALRHERGVQVPSRADDRRDRLCELVERTDTDRLLVLGDLMHSIGDPGGAERGELEVLFETMPPVDVTLVKGNHDGAIESWLEATVNDRSPARPGADPAGAASLTVVPGDGERLGSLGVCHGHSWPSPEVLDASAVCTGHEHPCVRLEDEVGGSRVEPAWLRGRLDLAWFREQPRYAEESLPEPDDAPDLVVLPAFNELAGGTWVNVDGQSFLSPFLPDGLADGEAYLLDGTRLGPYGSI